ncbi:MAG: HAD family hydrolase [bacterium]|nr:HAD family hydrolase [bacterium]
MARAVVYDVDGTLYPLWPMRFYMIRELAWRFAHSPLRLLREVRILQVYRSMLDKMRGQTATDSNLSDPQLHASAKKLGMDASDIHDTVHEWVARRPLRFLPRIANTELIETIIKLNHNGVPQGVYSDYPPDGKLAALGLGGCFQSVIWSGQRGVGEFKPSAKGFTEIARMLEVEPSEVVFVGDRESRDGKGARAVGMQFLHIKNFTSKRLCEMLAG